MNGLYFNDDNEPESVAFNLMEDVARICKQKGITFIKMNFDSATDYYNALQTLRDFNDKEIKVYGTSIEGDYDILLENEQEIDDSGSLSAEEKEAEEKKAKKKKEARK